MALRRAAGTSEAAAGAASGRPVCVALDCRAAESRMSGVGRYIVNLAEGLARRPDVTLVLLVGEDRHASLAALPGVRLVDLPWRQEHKTYAVRLRWEQRELRTVLRRLRPDVYHATWNFGVPLPAPFRTVLTLHDLLPIELGMSFGSRSAKLAFLAAQTVSLVAAHRVITGSEAAREVLRRFFPRSWRKSETILDGVEDLFVPGAQPGRRAYVLYVGGRDERKNLRGVFLGYAAAVARGGMELPLHVAGGRESLLPGDAAVLDGLPEEVRHRIRFIGFVADSQMPELYRDAAALLFPSRGERFGFPPLEAIACGTPVVTTRLGSIPEVVGEAALFADPDDPGAIGAALVSAVTDEAVRARLVSAGIRRADDLRWRACVDRTAAVYRRLAQRP